MPRVQLAVKRVESQSVREPAANAAGDEAVLARRAGQGDEPAFRVLVDRHLGGALSVARRMLRDDAEAEDVAQEAMLRLWRSAAALDVGVGGVRPWLRRVVSNLCIDRTRTRARLVVTDDVPEVPDAPRQLEALENEELRQRVDRALKALPERQRLALTLFHYEGLSQIEIGAEMGISDEAVESLLARARRQLKVDLKAEWQGVTGTGDDKDKRNG